MIAKKIRPQINTFIRLLLCILCIEYTVIPVSAQPEKELKYYQNKYPGENAVDMLRKQTLQIVMKEGKPFITHEILNERIILTDLAYAFATEKVYFSSFDSILEIEAYTFVPNGNAYKKIKVNDFSYFSDISNTIFYDDSKVCRFIYPSLTKGSKIIYRVKKQITNPYFLPSLFFEMIRAVEKSEIELIYDNQVQILFDEIGIEVGKLKTITKKDKKRTTLVLEMKDIPSFDLEENVNSFLPYFPHIIPRISSYQPSQGQPSVNILPSLDYLHTFYHSITSNINTLDDVELRHLSDSLTAHVTDEKEKVQAIYSWVQHHIRYIAFEDGFNGFIPTDAALVLSKRYADCKGMSNIMKALLEKAGIKSYLTWVGTNSLPYKYTEIPSPVIDNHMVLCYFDKEGKPYILDATADFHSIEYAPTSIQGKECLVGIDSNTYRVLEIPFRESETIRRSIIWIDSTSLQVQETLLYKGDPQYRNAHYFANKTEDEERKVFSENLADKGYPKSIIQKLSHSNFYAVEDTLSFNSRYTLLDYVLQNNSTLYLKSYFPELKSSFIEIPKRKTAFELKEKQHLIWEQTLQIPQGYEVRYIPENLQFDHSLFSFRASIQSSENQIFIKVDYQTHFITLPISAYEKWNQMNRMIREFNMQSFVFESKL